MTCSPRSTGRTSANSSPRRRRSSPTHEPLTALARWLDRVADYAQVKRGVFAAVEAGVSQDLAAHSLGPIGEALTALLDAGKADGTIRPDVDARDVILLIGYLTRLEQDEWDARSRHLLQVILDGLRARDRGRRDPGRRAARRTRRTVRTCGLRCRKRGRVARSWGRRGWGAIR